MIVRDLWARLGMDVERSSFAKAQDALGRLHLAFGGLKDIVETVKGRIDDLLEGTAQRAFDSKNLSQVTGIAVERVQELQYAAKVSNVSTEEFSHGLVHLARTAQEAMQGSAEAGAAFFQVGVSAVDGNGKLKPLDQLLGDVASRFAEMPDGTRKAALAMQLFSRGGARMIQFLDRGPAGLAKLGEEARKAGVVLSKDGIETSMKYHEANLKLEATIEGVKNAIALKLFPAITKSKEAFVALIQTHRQWLALKMGQAIEFLSRALHGVFSVVKGVIDLFQRIWNMSTAAKVALGALGLTIVALVAPWTLLAAAIALVAEDFELYLSSHGKAKTVTGVLIDLFTLLRKKVGGIFQGFADAWKELGQKNTFQFLYDHASKFFDWFVDQAAELPERIAQKIMTEKTRKYLDDTFGAPPRPTQEQMEETQRSGANPHHVPSTSEGFYNLIGNLFGVGPEIERMHLLEGAAAPAPPEALSISFGDIYIQGVDSPAGGRNAGMAFLEQVKPRIGEIVDDIWREKLRETAAAVSR